MVLQFQYRGDNFTALVQGEYDIFLVGEQLLTDHASFYASTNPKNTIISKDTQAKGHGWRTLIEITYQGITLVPFFNYFSIDDSTPVNIHVLAQASRLGEWYQDGPLYPNAPANITIETGVKLGYQF